LVDLLPDYGACLATLRGRGHNRATGWSLQVAVVDGQLNIVGERGFFLTSYVVTALISFTTT